MESSILSSEEDDLRIRLSCFSSKEMEIPQHSRVCQIPEAEARRRMLPGSFKGLVYFEDACSKTGGRALNHKTLV